MISTGNDVSLTPKLELPVSHFCFADSELLCTIGIGIQMHWRIYIHTYSNCVVRNNSPKKAVVPKIWDVLKPTLFGCLFVWLFSFSASLNFYKQRESRNASE